MSHYRPFGDMYHICLGTFLSSDSHSLVWKWISSEKSLQVKEYLRARGAEEVLKCEFEGYERKGEGWWGGAVCQTSDLQNLGV